MAGETEGAVRREPRYGSALMTCDTVHVGFTGVRIPARRAAVTGGAIAAGCLVMLLVATLAAHCGGRRGEGYGRGVAREARDPVVALMAERNFARAVGRFGSSRLDVNRLADLELLHAGCVMTGRAIGL